MNELLHDSELAKIVLVGGVAIFWIGAATVKGVIVGLSRERTKREIAAYISEGSMTPEQGERLVRANPKNSA